MLADGIGGNGRMDPSAAGALCASATLFGKPIAHAEVRAAAISNAGGFLAITFTARTSWLT